MNEPLIRVTIYALAAFGFAYIIGFSKISLPFREWLEIFGRRFAPARWLLALIECPACVGFWWGVALANTPWALALGSGTAFERSIGHGLVTTALNLLLAKAVGLI